MNELTPVLYVSEIEPCLSFWTRLGAEEMGFCEPGGSAVIFSRHVEG